MTWPGFYSLSALWLVLLAIPVVVFYFLKLKRPRLSISSLALWQQVLNDNRVNSPFQRFKRNILLLLQLLLLLFLVLAAMQPHWRSEVTQARRLPILIDCSASMAALNKQGGISRLEEAKEKVRRMIDGLAPDQQLCLISFSDSARRLTDFTNNKHALRDALDKIEVEDVASNIEDALRMAQALGRVATFDEVMLLSDGNFPERANFELSFKLDYQRLAPAAPNFGITSLNARRAANGKWDVFVQIEGSANAAATAKLEVWQDGVVAENAPIVLGKGGAQRLTFQVGGDKPSSLMMRLDPDEFDSLGSDNVAYLALPASRPLRVFVPVSLGTFRRALGSLKGIELFPETAEQNRADASYDLLVTDRVEDLGIEARTALSIGVVPDDLKNLISIESKGTQVVDWRRGAALLQHVELSDLVMMDQPLAAKGVSEGSYENLGYQVLIYGLHGPLLLEKHDGGKLTYHLLFHPDRSTLPYRVGFPILMTNLMQIAASQAGLSEANGHRTGVLAPVTLQANRDYQIEGPSGVKRDAKSDTNGILSGISATRVGEYVVRDSGDERARIGAALLSANETALGSVEQIQFNEELKVNAATFTPKIDREFWKWFAVLGFCVLLVEWWYFQRRPGGWRQG